MPNRRVKARTAERREKTLQLVRSGMPYRQVVRALEQSGIKTSPATVSRDLEFPSRASRDQSPASAGAMSCAAVKRRRIRIERQIL